MIAELIFGYSIVCDYEYILVKYKMITSPFVKLCFSPPSSGKSSQMNPTLLLLLLYQMTVLQN